MERAWSLRCINIKTSSKLFNSRYLLSQSVQDMKVHQIVCQHSKSNNTRLVEMNKHQGEALQGVHVAGVVLAHLINLLLSLALHSPVLLPGKLSLVKTPKVKIDSSVDAHSEGQHADGSTVSGAVVRLIGVAEEERGGNTSRVSDGDKDTTGERSLAVSGLVDSDPSHTGSRSSPKTDGDNEAASETHGLVVVDDEQDVAEHHDESSTDTEEASLLSAVADSGADEVGSKANDVDRDGKTLNLLGSPGPHLIDNGGQEDTETVKDRVAAVLSNGESPNLPVFDGGNDILLVHLLASCRLTNFSASKINKCLTVLGCETLGCSRFVGKDEGNSESSQDSRDTIDGDDPSPGSPSASTTLVTVIVIQLSDTKGDKTTDSTRDGRDGVKVGIAERNVLLVVEGGEVQPMNYKQSVHHIDRGFVLT